MNGSSNAAIAPVRFLALDFTTSGFQENSGPELKPWQNYPCSVAIYAVNEEGEVEHLYSSMISGAQEFNAWAKTHHPFTPADLEGEPSFSEVVADISALVRPGDVLVAHNCHFDIDSVLRDSCARMGVDDSAITSLPRFCTCRSAWAVGVNGDRWLSLFGLCSIEGVRPRRTHAAAGEAETLAQCLSKALRSAAGQSLGLKEALMETARSGRSEESEGQSPAAG